jgi:hypothetical protein
VQVADVTALRALFVLLTKKGGQMKGSVGAIVGRKVGVLGAGDGRGVGLLSKYVGFRVGFFVGGKPVGAGDGGNMSVMTAVLFPKTLREPAWDVTVTVPPQRVSSLQPS